MSSPSPDTLDILVVDDSATYRMLLARAVKSWPSGNPVGSAGDGEQALALIAQVKPDLVLLDVTMPVLDGIETLKRIRARWADVDVIMCSGVDSGQTGLTMQALSLGALDFVPKPVCDTPAESFAALSSALLPLLGLALERKRRRTLRAPALRPAIPPSPAPVVALPPTTPGASLPSLRPTANPSLPTVPPPRAIVPPVRSAVPAPAPAPSSTSVGGLARRPPARIEVMVVGVSTGGPNALQQFVPSLPADLPFPVLCVQHMPPMFTASLAERLDRASPLSVIEGAEGMVVKPGVFHIAPGGYHMVVVRGKDGLLRIALNQGEPVNSCRPAADVLFQSVDAVVGGNVVSVVLTGMGCDGAAGVRALRARGAWSVVQDEATSVVWGMPGAVVQQGCADEILPLDRIAGRIIELARRGSMR